MKKGLLYILIFMLLTGCSYITIDDAQTTETVITNNSPAETPAIDKLIEIVDVFDLLERKTLEAKDIYYLALGDSLTRGVGDENKNFGYTGILADEWEKSPNVLSVELDNRGKNGRRSDQLLALLEKGHYDEELEKANVISISIGGNDLMKIVKSDLFNLQTSMFDNELPHFVSRYEKIVHYIRSKSDAPILLVGFYNPFSIISNEITPFKTIMSSWNGEIETISNNTANACFFSVDDLFETNEDMVYHTDFFHPNGKGYQKMANRIMETLPNCELGEFTDLIEHEGS